MISLIYFKIMLAGDIMPAKTVLQKDSYVFTIEEAEKLKLKIQDLEKKEQLLSEYIKLESLREKQIDSYKKVVDMQEDQAKKYDIMIDSKDKQIKILLEREDDGFFKKAIIFGSGVLLTAGSLYAADKLDDSIEK